MTIPLTTRQRALLEELHDAHEGQLANGGLLHGEIGDRHVEVQELLILGLVHWHPPRAPRYLLPTALGRERVMALRERSKRSKKASGRPDKPGRKRRTPSGQVRSSKSAKRGKTR